MDRTKAKVAWVRKVFDDGMHNAVTDLVHWRGAYYLCFRRAEEHMLPPYGDVVLLRSTDLREWTQLPSPGTDLDDRDPKFLVDGQRLGLCFGGVGVDTDADGRRIFESMTVQTYISWTTDGQRWSIPSPIYKFGWWLWHPHRFSDGFWCAAYGRNPGQDPRAGCVVDLVHSADGADWEYVTTLQELGKGDESVLHKTGAESMLAIVRGKGDETFLMRADAPYLEWETSTVDHWMHAPATATVGNTLVAAGRDQRGQKDAVTRLWAIEGGQTRVLCDLPSGGDTSYCGLLAIDEHSLLVSYYSQHEFMKQEGFAIGKKPAAIYLACVVIQG